MRAAAAVALILLSLAGCDNVSWGGAEVTVVPPPERVAASATESTPRVVQRGPVSLPTGPILYHVRSVDGEGRLTPIAEITDDSLDAFDPGANASAFADAFIAERMREGAEFVLFHNGGRVGAFVVRTAAFDGGSPCRPLPSAQGVLELGPMGAGVREFLAMERSQAPQDFGRGTRPELTRNMQVVAPILAERLMRKRGASLPGDWQRAFASGVPFPLERSGSGFGATFLVGDTLGPGLDDQGYSMFFIGEPVGTSYDTTYVSYRPYPEQGKQAPVVIDFLDWDRDGQVELLMRLWGVSDSWLEALDRDDRGHWHRTFQDRCTVPTEEISPGAAPPPDTATG